jgi:putative hydrolase of the HAD superfamily
VLFDLDDTLMDHTGASTAALRAWIPTFGVAEDDIDPLMNVWADLEQQHWPAWRAGEISFAEQRRRRARDFMIALGRTPTDDELDTIYAGYLTRYVNNWAAFPDASPTLGQATAAGLLVGVLTNGNQDQQTAKLAATGLVELCGPVFASSTLPRAKPHPDAYHEACRQLGVAPEETLMVGDNYELDVVAARAAGLSAIHLDRAATGSTTAAISTLTDLPLPV